MSTTFEAFLATRPQLQLDTNPPVSGWCACPDRYRVGTKPILIRHTVCDNEGFAYLAKGDRLMHATTLESLAAWIPVPPPAPAADPNSTVIVIERMLALGFHLVKLHAGEKAPVGTGWNDPARTPALTRDEAIAHVQAGGGLGVLLGPSRLIVIDAENAAAVQALLAAGLRPVLYTAKGMCPVACDPRVSKVGGGHVWLCVPEGVDVTKLDNVPQAAVGDGGLVDVLVAPGSMAVVPPTALVEAGGWAYTADGSHPVWSTEGVPTAPAWMFDASVPCPDPAVASLHGRLVPAVRAERGPVTEAQAELSSEIDQVSWEAVAALDTRMESWGDVDPECGCDQGHWRDAEKRKSYTLHDCGRGSYIHIWSLTMRADLGLSDGEATLSKMQLACRLLGVEPRGAGFRAVAQRFGVDLGGALPSFADQLDEAAEVIEARAADPAQCTGSVKRPDPAAVPELVSIVDGVETRRTSGEVTVPATEAFWRGEAMGMRGLALLLRGDHHPEAVFVRADSVVGAPAPAQPALDGEIVDAEVVEQAPAPPSTETSVAVDDAIQGEVVTEWEDGDQAMWERIREIEAKLRGERDPHTLLWTGMTPGLGRIANIAERDGVYYHGVIEPILARISARVPANVLIEPRNGNRENKISGLSLTYNVLTFGAPATAKTTSMATAESAVPFPPGIAVKPSGTAEGLVKAARRKVGGGHGRLPEQKIVATSVFACTDEIGTVKSELKRDASKYIYHVNSAYFGNSVLGQTASEDSRDVTIPPHGVRMSQLFGAQPQLCSELWEHAGSGFDARWAAVFAGSHAKEDLGPLFGKPVPALLPNGLPWDPPVGIPYGFSPAGVIEDEETGEKTLSYEADAPEDLPPVWIAMPKAAKEGAEEALARSADRSRHTRRAMLHDMEANRSEGHEGVRTRKAAALLAILDGLENPEEVHWRAAELLCEASNLAIEESIAQSEMYRDHQAKKSGRTKGLEMASGRAAAEHATADAVAAAAEAIYNKLTRPVEGTLVRGKLAKGFGGTATVAQITAAKVIGSRHSGYIQQGFDRLVNERRISVAAVGDDRRQWRVTAQGALTAAPPINGIAS